MKPVAIPQVQFLDKVRNDRLDGLDSAENCGIPQVQFLDVLVQTVLKPVMIPQLHFSDKDVDMLVILGSRRAENCELFTVSVPARCCPVVVQRQVACPAVDADS